MNQFKQKEQELVNSIDAKIEVLKVLAGKFEINYIKTGQGFSLILLHGANIGWGQWQKNIHEFSKYFTVFALDLPGAGGSTKIDFSKLNLERDLVDIIEKFVDAVGIGEHHIVGHSLGAWIAVKLALRPGSRVKKLVLTNPIGFSSYVPFKYRLIALSFVAKLISKTVMKPTKKNMEKFLQSVLYDSQKLDQRFIDYFYAAVHKDKLTHPILLISQLSSFWRMKRELVFNDIHTKINDILILVGEKDHLIPPGKIKLSKFPSVSFKIIQNSGHVIPLEKSTEFNRLVINFLKT